MLTPNEISLLLYQTQGEIRAFDEGFHVVLELPDGTRYQARWSEWCEAENNFIKGLDNLPQ